MEGNLRSLEKSHADTERKILKTTIKKKPSPDSSLNSGTINVTEFQWGLKKVLWVQPD